jgi:hypothetical protein
MIDDDEVIVDRFTDSFVALVHHWINASSIAPSTQCIGEAINASMCQSLNR